MGGGHRGLRAIEIFPNFSEPSLPCSQDAETDRNHTPNYILFNSQGGTIVHLLELRHLNVLLPIPKITDEQYRLSRMVINRRNLK